MPMANGDARMLGYLDWPLMLMHSVCGGRVGQGHLLWKRYCMTRRKMPITVVVVVESRVMSTASEQWKGGALQSGKEEEKGDDNQVDAHHYEGLAGIVFPF